MTRVSATRAPSSNMRGVVLATLGLILFLVLCLTFFAPPPKQKLQHSHHHHNKRFHTTGSLVHGIRSHTTKQQREQKQHRIAVVIPFAGDGIESVPAYFELFCTAAQGSASLVDFLIIHNGALEHLQQHSDLPSNVILINLESTQSMAQALLRVTDRRSLSHDLHKTLQNALMQQLKKYPYILVEYKPALGHVFQEHLKSYSHWGYSDLDIIFGDLPKWITPKELTEYDIVTYGYGDQDRVYLRGQFTFHKNNDKVNQLWRECKYLSELDVRFEKLMSGEEKHFSLESAEGCYSSVVLKQNDFKVKYAVKAFTDVSTKDTADTHGLYLGFGSQKNEEKKSVVYKHGQHAQDVGLLPTRWLEEKEYTDSPLQWEVGQQELVVLVDSQKKKKKKCMYWVQEKYQADICVPGLESTETVYWINGKLYKQSFEMASFRRGIVTAPFFHFQEWKRYYRAMQLSPCSRRRQGGLDACVLTKEGAIPLAAPQEEGFLRPTFPLGLEKISKWKGDRKQLPTTGYCLRPAARTYPPPPASKCDFMAYWQDDDLLEFLSGAPKWRHLRGGDVTLALTLQISDMESANTKMLNEIINVVLASIGNWQDQPSVLVMDVAGATDEAVAIVRAQFGIAKDNGLLDSCLVAALFHGESDFVSRKALLNMARDVAPTRWILSGLEVERGLILSREASLFAQRSAEVYSESSGTVLFVPQFSISTEDAEQEEEAIGEMTTLSLSSLLEAKATEDTQVIGPDRLDCGFCEDEEDGSDSLFKGPNSVWYELTRHQVIGEFQGQSSISELAADLENFQQSLIGLLTSPKLDEIYAINTSPILLVDNVGPASYTRTVELAREVEEFGGMQCYNGLWLAQLAALGFSVNVLPGAFAASSSSTRRIACRRLSQNGTPGTSRCDGCFLFDEEHQNILDAIAQDERVRPAKTTLLWQATS